MEQETAVDADAGAGGRTARLAGGRWMVQYHRLALCDQIQAICIDPNVFAQVVIAVAGPAEGDVFTVDAHDGDFAVAIAGAAAGPADKMPDGIGLLQNRLGQLQAGLFAAWQLVAVFTDGALSRLFDEQRNTLLDYLNMRNGSILAHGFMPLSQQQWQGFALWIESQLLPAFIEDAGVSIIRTMPPQLPAAYVFK